MKFRQFKNPIGIECPNCKVLFRLSDGVECPNCGQRYYLDPPSLELIANYRELFSMEKEEYQKYIQNGTFGHLLVWTPKLERLMQERGIYCEGCKRPFIPQPYYRESYPNAHHYPTKTHCGFCVYDMDALKHSQLLEEDDDY